MIEKNYLKHSEFIDCKDKNIKEQAKFLSSNCYCDFEIAKNCFKYVRDEIKHSYDYKLNPVSS
jgi:hypothetical protein